VYFIKKLCISLYKDSVYKKIASPISQMMLILLYLRTSLADNIRFAMLYNIKDITTND